MAVSKDDSAPARIRRCARANRPAASGRRDQPGVPLAGAAAGADDGPGEA
jgi:hypothetical protein